MYCEQWANFIDQKKQSRSIAVNLQNFKKIKHPLIEK